MSKTKRSTPLTAMSFASTIPGGTMNATLKTSKQKLSHEIARQIARNILEEDMQEGDFLGNEPELLKRYAISRDTFREALRVLEWQGLANTTRGPNGGLVVARPSQDAIVNILRDYFDLTDISFEEIMGARRRLQRLTVRLATMRLTEDVVPHLEALLEVAIEPAENIVDEILAQMRLIQEIGRASENTALSLFISPLDYVASDFANLENLSREGLGTKSKQGENILKRMVNAIIANEESRAIRQVNAYNSLLDKVVQSGQGAKGEKLTIYPQWFDSGRSKSGQSLIYQIKQGIEDLGLEIGDRLGSEAELIEKYGVSRSIFREASRILELIGITQSRKGRNGGLIVAKADPTNTIEAAAHFLEQSDLPYNQFYEARVALDTYAAELAAKRATDDQIAELEKALSVEATAKSPEEFLAAASYLHIAICHAGGNRVIGLYIDILMNSTFFRPTQKKQLKRLMDNKGRLVRSHERIVQDIKNRDPKSASRHMRDHRAQVAGYLQV